MERIGVQLKIDQKLRHLHTQRTHGITLNTLAYVSGRSGPRIKQDIHKLTAMMIVLCRKEEPRVSHF
jgi:hypothetical protein